MKKLWTYSQELRAKYPNGGVATGIEVLKHMCSPGTDTRAVSYRSMMLGLLEMCLKRLGPAVDQAKQHSKSRREWNYAGWMLEYLRRACRSIWRVFLQRFKASRYAAVVRVAELGYGDGRRITRAACRSICLYLIP